MEVTGKGKSDDKTVTVDGLKIFMSVDTQQKLSASTIDYTSSGEFSIKGQSSCCG
jgi:Fe-S cluster assembly iron-binding protein IscA